MLSLQVRMTLLLAALFGIIYAIVVMVGTSMGYGGTSVYLFIAIGLMFIQYLIGPKMIEWTMGVKYVTRQEEPELVGMVEDLARRANIPVPRVAVSEMGIPNAFAFGRGIRDGRVCVTRMIMNLLDKDELRAVLGHELTHIRNRDVLTITLLSVIPTILWHIAWRVIFSGGRRDDRGGAGYTFLIGIAAFAFYFISNLLVLYASRIREYYADKGSVELGNRPSSLASALYKLVYGAARVSDTGVIQEVQSAKAFFLNDPSKALNEFKDLAELDMDKNGSIDSNELFRLRHKEVKISGGEKFMELLSTHPNMLKRIKHLASLGAGA